MAFCPNCGNRIDENARFCNSCGTAVVNAAPPAPAEPVVLTAPVVPVVPAAPQYIAPDYTPKIPGKVKAWGFIGLGLGAYGLVYAVLGLIYAFIYMMAAMATAVGTGGYSGMGIAAMFFAVIMGACSFPPALIGRSLCGNSQDAGNTSRACSIGSKLCLAAIIVSAAMMACGFFALLF